jgi:F420-0:gamma-glutamyl ligase
MMNRTIGTVVRGVRAPIFREGDDIVAVTVDTVMNAIRENGITPHDRDIVAVTESVVARCQGNYATIADISADVRAKTGGKTVGVTFPILSRNRFSLLLKGIAGGCEKVVLLLSYPSDEVGNHLVSMDQLDEKGIDPWHDVLSLAQFRAAFGSVVHPFTGVDYVSFYQELIESMGAQAEIVFGNRVQSVLDYTDTVICCDIHTRARSKRLLKAAGARVVLGLDDLLNAPVNGSGYNESYGLLGSNKADEERIKLFPRDTMHVAEEIGRRMSEATGRHVEAMVYGDGAFKDPAGKIWELADPVVSPGYTDGLIGTPNELKLKYLADEEFADLTGDALRQAIEAKIKAKDAKVSLVGKMVSEGTTPRNLTDLIGSLCDLTSGSGDKGTPIVYIQGYFDNYTNE